MCRGKFEIGLVCCGKEIYHFCFLLLCIRGQISSASPPGGLYSEGRFNGGFLRGGGLIFGGAYSWRGLFWEFYGIYFEELLSFILDVLHFTSFFVLCYALLVCLYTLMDHLPCH